MGDLPFGSLRGGNQINMTFDWWIWLVYSSDLFDTILEISLFPPAIWCWHLPAQQFSCGVDSFSILTAVTRDD